MVESNIGMAVMSSRGQLVIPKHLRKKLKITPHAQLIIKLVGSTIIIKKCSDLKIK